MKFCSSGVAPEVGFAGENFKAGTHRANMIGKPLAGGKWRCLDSFLQEMFSHCSMVAMFFFTTTFQEFWVEHQLRGCYFAFKADLKARHECHGFTRWYQCGLTFGF